MPYTPDNGATWLQVPTEFGRSADDAIGYDGTFVSTLSPDGQFVGVQRWDPGNGAVTDFAFDPVDVAASAGRSVSVTDYVGSTVVLNDGRVFDLNGDRATRMAARFPDSSFYDPSYALTEDGATVVRATYPQADAEGYLTVIPLRGGGDAVTVGIENLLGMDVSGSTVHYLSGSVTRLKGCSAPVSDLGQTVCTTVSKGDYRASQRFGKLTTSAGVVQISVEKRLAPGDPEQWLVDDGLVVDVPTSWKWLPLRDTPMPMALAYSTADHLDMASTVDRTGNASPLFAGPAVPFNAEVYVLSVGRITYWQDHYTRSSGVTRVLSWRAINEDGTVGPAVDLIQPERPHVAVSAGRIAIQRDRIPKPGVQTDFYDQTTRTGSATGGYRDALELSGPYAKVGTRAVRVDGHEYETAPVLALFGSLVVEPSSPKEVARRTFHVRDLAAPAAEAVPVSLPQPGGRIYLNNDLSATHWRLWGDWITATYTEPGNVWGQLAMNYRTGKTVDLTGMPVRELGDGWVVLGDLEGSLRIRLLTTGEELEVQSAFETKWLRSDGIRTLTWSEDRTLNVVRVNGLPLTPPRLLGALATSRLRSGEESWEPQFDLTKEVQAGSLEIRDPAGSLIRSLPTDASTTGSVRNLSWDGRDTAGSLVLPGWYSWTLNVAAADGSGAAVSVDGRPSPAGRVEVTGD